MIGTCCPDGRRWQEEVGGSVCTEMCVAFAGSRRHESGPPVPQAGSGQQQPPRRGLQQPGRAGDAEGPRGTGQRPACTVDRLLSPKKSCPGSASTGCNLTGSMGLNPSLSCISDVTWHKSLVSETEHLVYQDRPAPPSLPCCREMLHHSQSLPTRELLKPES